MRLSRAPAWLLGISGWLVFSPLAQASDTSSLTLDALLEAGHANYPSLAKNPLIAESLKLSLTRANRSYLPRLSLGAQATWQSDVTSVNIPIPGANITPPPKDQYRATLDLQQSIWDGGVIHEQKQVIETRSRLEQEKVNLEWYQVQGTILHLYYTGVVQQELQQQGHALYEHLGSIVEQSKAALANGVVTERDVLLAQAKQLEAKQAVVDADARLAAVKQSLHELTALSFGENARLAAPTSRCNAPASEAINRPELNLLAQQTQLLDAQEKLDRAGDRPRLGLFATGGYGRPGLNFLNNTFKFYFIGGVQLTVPLTSLYAGTHQNGRKQTAVQRSLVAREQDRVLKQVKVESDTRDSEVKRLEATLAVDDELVQIREKATKQTEMQFTLGTVSMTDLIADLTSEDQARSKREIHRAERNLACHERALIKGDL